MNENYTDDRKYAWLYINLIWGLWIVNQLFFQVILLNFLIAMVNNSFDQQTKKQLEVEYIHKCAVNEEIALLEKAWASTYAQARRYLCCCCSSKKPNQHDDDDDADDHDGFNALVIF